MTEFEDSLWTDGQFVKNYQDDASIYLPFRKQFYKTGKLIFEMFVSDRPEIRILDLGCGDGLFVKDLLRSFNISQVMMVDGSHEMLDAAMQQIKDHRCVKFVKASFQKLLQDDPFGYQFDFIFSSLALHHINLEQKEGIYRYCYDHLKSDGYFLNYDVILPPNDRLEGLYLSMWYQWITTHPNKNRAKGLHDIPDQYKANNDNIPDKLDVQLKNLRKIGFRDVDCIFKYGIFSLFGGRK
jgi:tRNA (cmo5U34)-methyltransferase